MQTDQTNTNTQLVNIILQPRKRTASKTVSGDM